MLLRLHRVLEGRIISGLLELVLLRLLANNGIRSNDWKARNWLGILLPSNNGFPVLNVRLLVIKTRLAAVLGLVLLSRIHLKTNKKKTRLR